MTFAETSDGAELYWTSVGSGPPLLLIAGQASSYRGWLSVVDDLADDHEVIMFDHRGVGKSSAEGIAHATTRSFAADAVAVLDAAGVSRAHVYGHSMGGRVAQWVAIDYPERVNRLVLAATTGGASLTVERDHAATEALVSGRIDRLAPYFFSDAFREDHPNIVARFFDIQATRAALRAHFAASTGHDAWSDLHGITARTLVVHGGEDRITPVQNALNLVGAISGAERYIEPHSRHALHLESHEVQRRVLAFLAES